MSSRLKLLFGITMSLALAFGFLHSVWPETWISLKRLHIFLFNLLTGGSLVLYYSKATRGISKRIKLFFALALLYALAAAVRWYIPALILSVPLFIIVESVRIQKFSLLPLEFFSAEVSISRKFNQASLLCLSIGIVFASLVILNNEFFKLVSYEKLTLDVFFLGYSFPISLITMSVMFSFMTGPRGKTARVLEELSFWFVNVGVVTFFAFIIFEVFIAEIIVSTTLFITVCVIFVLFLRTAPRVQQKTFLTSGMVFLLFTGVTGILYIVQYFWPAIEQYREYFLVLHAMVSLYGWNLSGLFIILRWYDFPIKLNSVFALTLHWIIVLVLAPFARFEPMLGLITVPAYMALLLIVLWGRGNGEVAKK